MLLAVGSGIFAVVGCWYAARAFWLKSGLRIRGAHTITSSVDCDDQFVSSLTLENLKDRAVVVFKVFLEIGHGVFVEVEDFEQAPLTLLPFQAYHKEYGPIEFYSAGMQRVDLNELLARQGSRRRLVLATSEGKYVVREWVKYWDPISVLLLQNDLTFVVSPRRSNFQGEPLGSNAKYVVILKLSNAKEEVITLRAMDHTITRFRNFRLTEAALASREALEAFLLERAMSGELPVDDIVVHDLAPWRAERFEDWNKSPLVVTARSWTTYYILGRTVSWWRRRIRRKMNRKRKAERLALGKGLSRAAMKPAGDEKPKPPTA